MPLKNKLHRKQKIAFIRPLRHQLFGTDFQLRDSMSEDEAVARFDDVWTQKISSAIEAGDIIDHDEAVSLISKAGLPFCTAQGHTHYRFKLANTVFVAQVTTSSSEHNQLWAVTAQNYDTRTVFATFDQQDDRDAWTRLASRFDMSAEELAKRVLTAHLRAFDDV